MKGVRTLLVAIGLAVMVTSSPATAVGVRAADAFVDGFVDLPLMPGLAQIDDATVAFDTTAGRIVVAFLRGEVDEAAVLAFYGGALPELGWHAVEGPLFHREGETLSLDFVADGSETVVRISLSPGRRR